MHIEPNWGLKSFQIQALLLQFYTQMDSHMAGVNTFADTSLLTTLNSTQ